MSVCLTPFKEASYMAGWATRRPQLSRDTKEPTKQQTVMGFVSLSSVQKRTDSHLSFKEVFSVFLRRDPVRGFICFAYGSESNSPFSVVMVHRTGSFSG